MRVLSWTTALAACVLCAVTAAAEAAPPTALLELAWRAASAITNDAGDRARCRQHVAEAWLEEGDVAAARQCAAAMTHWRRGIVLAEIASTLAARGEREAAALQLVEAESYAATVDDWPRDRLAMHIAEARALLDAPDTLASVAERYAADPDNGSRAVACQAVGLARAGRLDEARAALKTTAGSKHIDKAHWHAAGYLMLARHGRLDAAGVSNVLDEAWLAAGEVPGWMALELRGEVAAAWAVHGAAAKARARLSEVSAMAERAGLPAHLKVPLLVTLAGQWGRLGDTGAVARVAGEVETLIADGLQSIEKPAAHAGLAEAYALAGDVATATGRFEAAVAEAAALRNLRPRAMAAVAICLHAIHAGGIEAPVREGIERLVAGLYVGAN